MSEFTGWLVQYVYVPCKLGGGVFLSVLRGVVFVCVSSLPCLYMTIDHKPPGSCLITLYKNFLLNVFKCSLQYQPHHFPRSLVPLALNATGGLASFLTCAKLMEIIM